MRANSSCPHDDFGGNNFAAFYFDAAGNASYCWSVCADFNSLPVQALARMGGEAWVHTAQNIRACFQNDQANIGRANSAITLGDVAEQQIVPLGDEFDAGVTAAYDDECQKLAAQFVVRCVVGVLTDVQHA